VHGRRSLELRQDKLGMVDVAHLSLKNEEIASASTFPCTITSVRCPPGRSTSELPGMLCSSAAPLGGTMRSRRARMIRVLALTWGSRPRPSKDLEACRCASKA